ncbi:hypothetical protein [Nocardioides sp.]|uniref:hypothetical protein n=1 Tax=Nocardioides sp. TaxID=35761 RepID=UPI002608A280|nr:hypothetical protein [Nocardioides sp.]
MADEIFDTDTLASYLQCNTPLPARAVTIAKLANGLVYAVWSDRSVSVPSEIEAIGLEVAARAILNPKGLTSVTRAVDDGSQTERFSDATRAGVYLTDEERRVLLGVKARRRRSYGNIRLRHGL